TSRVKRRPIPTPPAAWAGHGWSRVRSAWIRWFTGVALSGRAAWWRRAPAQVVGRDRHGRTGAGYGPCLVAPPRTEGGGRHAVQGRYLCLREARILFAGSVGSGCGERQISMLLIVNH